MEYHSSTVYFDLRVGDKTCYDAPYFAERRNFIKIRKFTNLFHKIYVMKNFYFSYLQKHQNKISFFYHISLIFLTEWRQYHE